MNVQPSVLSLKVLPEDSEQGYLIEEKLYQYNKPFGVVHLPKQGAVLLAEKQGEALGGAKLPWRKDGYLSIGLLHVDEPRGQGVGTFLMNKIEDIVTENNCLGILTDTLAHQAPGFYPKFGFVEHGRIKDFLGGQDRIYFHKKLGAKK